MSVDLIDVAILGGGPAGLTAAATLARQLHTAVVFDSKSYRNERASRMHMVAGWEKADPREFRAKARRDIESNYPSVRFADCAVARVEKQTDCLFRLWDDGGREWSSRKVLLAVGSSDTYPDLEGYEALWARKIFHCLFCHGYEDRGAPSVGVLAVAPVVVPFLVLHMAENAAQLGERVVIYTNGNAELTEQLGSTFEVEPRPIRRLVDKAGTDCVTVELADGTARDETFLVHNPQTGVKGPFVAQLGLETTPMGDVQAKAPTYQTSVRGVFAAGDCITPYKVIPGALSSGCNAAVAASTQLQAEKHHQTPMF
ncbi:hypothetical protein CDD83_3836 [Cordyceps sp. RAO-2017]|nr:hypothetical protein CDD83_3836 [Cordyceps sp. RAO-2017]